MRIGFLIQRSTYLKNFGPLIDESIKSGHEVVLLYESAKGGGTKSYQNVQSNDFKFLRDRTQIAEVEISRLGQYHHLFGIDCLVLLESFNSLKNLDLLNALKELRSKGVVAVNLSYFFETCHTPLESLDYFDRTYFLSEFACELFLKLHSGGDLQLQQLRKRFAPKMAAMGSPLYEQIGLAQREKSKISLGLPQGRPIVILMAPVFRPDMQWRWILWQDPDLRTRIKRAVMNRKWTFGIKAMFEPTFKESVDAIKDFCRRNDAILVVKSRQKQDDPDYLSDSADIYFDGQDDHYYPVFSTYELLVCADLLIQNQSMSATEALVAGVPSVNIYVPHREFIADAKKIHIDYLDTISSGRPDSILNFQGCVTSIQNYKFSKWIRGKQLSEFRIDGSRREEYKRRFLGEADQTSSSRILQDIVSLSARHRN